jgi:hypothetical protein
MTVGIRADRRGAAHAAGFFSRLDPVKDQGGPALQVTIPSLLLDETAPS